MKKEDLIWFVWVCFWERKQKLLHLLFLTLNSILFISLSVSVWWGRSFLFTKSDKKCWNSTGATLVPIYLPGSLCLFISHCHSERREPYACTTTVQILYSHISGAMYLIKAKNTGCEDSNSKNSDVVPISLTLTVKERQKEMCIMRILQVQDKYFIWKTVEVMRTKQWCTVKMSY